METDQNETEKLSPYDFFKREQEEIERHKWHLSEQAGYDIGFETALLDWLHHHRAEWVQEVREQFGEENQADNE